MKLPGFRQGKIPPTIVIQRLGREPILDEAVRGQLTSWYMNAIDESGIAPVGDPKVDLGDLPDEGKPLTFSFEVGVRPTAQLGTYRGVEVGRREPSVDDEAIDEEIEGLRERSAHLHTVKRPAKDGDFLTIDFEGTVDGEPFPGGEGRDQLIELGSGNLIPGFEEGLLGAVAGEQRTVTATFPEEYGAKHVAGKEAEFEIQVKEIKHKHLPDLDDEFASDAAGFDTLEELRENIRERMLERDAENVESEFRAGALDAIVDEATIEVPDPLIEARASELLTRMLHALGHQGIDKAAYLKISGKTDASCSRTPSPRPSWRSSARPCLRRSSRPRTSSRPSSSCSTRSRAPPSASRCRARSCSTACATRVASTCWRRRSRPSRRWTSSSPRPSRSRSSRPRSAPPSVPPSARSAAARPRRRSASPPRARRAEPKDDLWTPDKDAEATAGDKKLWTPDS